MRHQVALHRLARSLQRRYQRQPSRKQRRKHAREDGNLVFQPDITQQRDLQLETIHLCGALVTPHPAPEEEPRASQHQRRVRGVLSRVDADREHQRGHGRQLGAKLVIQVGELRHYERDQECQQHEQHNDKQRGIYQRRYQFLAEAYRQTLKRNETSQHFLEIAASFAGQQRGRINLGKDFLRRKGFRQQFATAQPLTHVLQQRAEEGIALPFKQQFQRLNDRQPGVNQGHKLLVEDDKLVLRDFAALRQTEIGRQQAFGLDRIH